MPDLILSNSEGDTIAEIPINQQGLVTVGRSEGNDLVIPSDLASRRHAIVFEHEQRWFTADLGSKSGLCNAAGGTRYHEFTTTEDWVRLGPAYLWLHGAPAAQPPGRPKLNVDADPGRIHLPAEFDKSLAEHPRIADAPMPFFLVFQEEHAAPSRMVDLTHVQRLTLGRGRTCDIVLEDQGVSRLHSIIYREGRHFFIADTGSSRGLRADGSRWLRKRLNPGTLLQFGNITARVMSPESPVSEGLGKEAKNETILDPMDDGSVFAPLESMETAFPTAPHRR